MSKKSLKLGVALAAGAGAAAVLAKNSKCHPVTSKSPSKSASSKNSVNSDYRNTERGKYEKKQQRYLLYKRKLRSIRPPGKTGRF